MPEQRLILIILVMGLLVSVLQIFIWKMSNGKVFFKYIPTIALFIVVLVCVVMALWFSEGMEDLAYFVTAMIVSGVLVISLVTGIVIDMVSKLRR